MCRCLSIVAVLVLSVSSRAHPGPKDESGEPTAAAVENAMKEAMAELKLAEDLQDMTNSTRESRGLLKKVAFLAGMRVGGMVHSSGTLAASNSMRIFGKVVNSALSVSYGSIDDLSVLPAVDERPASIDVPKTKELPPPVESAAVKIVSVEGRPLPISHKQIEEDLHRRIKSGFLERHNDLVDRANSNSKYLRVSREKVYVKNKEPGALKEN